MAAEPTTTFRPVATSAADMGLWQSDAVFAQTGAPAPYVLWAPNPGLAENPVVHRFAEICDRLSQNKPMISSERFDLNHFGAIQDWLMVLSLTQGGTAYRYDHYGCGIANIYGKDMTGRTTDDFPEHISAFYTKIYDAVRDRRQRVLTVHQPPKQVFVSTWRRLIVPIGDQNDEVSRFVVLNLPENELRAGLEILPLPLLIVDETEVVRYANKEARKTFDRGAFGPWSRKLFDYAGLDLRLKESPSDILAHGIAKNSFCRHVTHQQIGIWEATISATRHHDHAFYVVLLKSRPDM